MSQGFSHCLFFKKSNKIWREGTSSPRISRTGSSSCQCSTTLSGKRMMRIVIRVREKSRITRWNFRKDIGRSSVQGRKRSSMEVFLTHKKENGILQPTKWCNDSMKLVIFCSKVSVPWVVESWSRRKVKVPFTSMEIRWTQNSFSKQFSLYISSVFTEQQRTGVINSVWQKKKRDEPVFLWTTRFLTKLNPEEVQLSSNNSDWKQDARKRFELRSAGR